MTHNHKNSIDSLSIYEGSAQIPLQLRTHFIISHFINHKILSQKLLIFFCTFYHHFVELQAINS